jgi:hypothetical protein
MSKRGLIVRLYPAYQTLIRVNVQLPKGIFNCVKYGRLALESPDLMAPDMKTARLRLQTGGSAAVRPFGGITPEGYSFSISSR